MVKIRPIILAERVVDYGDELIAALKQVELFFDAYALPIDYSFELPEVIWYTGSRDIPGTELWMNVKAFVEPRLAPGEKAVVLVDGWVTKAGDSVGWGGNPVAMAGHWVIERLQSHGSPEAIVDDGAAAGVLAHEVGHVLGFGHDMTKPNNIMWTGLYNFPEVYPSQAMIDMAQAAGCPPKGED